MSISGYRSSVCHVRRWMCVLCSALLTNHNIYSIIHAFAVSRCERSIVGIIGMKQLLLSFIECPVASVHCTSLNDLRQQRKKPQPSDFNRLSLHHQRSDREIFQHSHVDAPQIVYKSIPSAPSAVVRHSILPN